MEPGPNLLTLNLGYSSKLIMNSVSFSSRSNGMPCTVRTVFETRYLGLGVVLTSDETGKASFTC